MKHFHDDLMKHLETDDDYNIDEYYFWWCSYNSFSVL